MGNLSPKSVISVSENDLGIRTRGGALSLSKSFVCHSIYTHLGVSGNFVALYGWIVGACFFILVFCFGFGSDTRRTDDRSV